MRSIEEILVMQRDIVDRTLSVADQFRSLGHEVHFLTLQWKEIEGTEIDRLDAMRKAVTTLYRRLLTRTDEKLWSKVHRDISVMVAFSDYPLRARDRKVKHPVVATNNGLHFHALLFSPMDGPTSRRLATITSNRAAWQDLFAELHSQRIEGDVARFFEHLTDRPPVGCCYMLPFGVEYSEVLRLGAREVLEKPIIRDPAEVWAAFSSEVRMMGEQVAVSQKLSNAIDDIISDIAQGRSIRWSPYIAAMDDDADPGFRCGYEFLCFLRMLRFSLDRRGVDRIPVTLAIWLLFEDEDLGVANRTLLSTAGEGLSETLISTPKFETLFGRKVELASVGSPISRQ